MNENSPRACTNQRGTCEAYCVGTTRAPGDPRQMHGNQRPRHSWPLFASPTGKLLAAGCMWPQLGVVKLPSVPRTLESMMGYPSAVVRTCSAGLVPPLCCIGAVLVALGGCVGGWVGGCVGEDALAGWWAAHRGSGANSTCMLLYGQLTVVLRWSCMCTLQPSTVQPTPCARSPGKTAPATSRCR